MITLIEEEEVGLGSFLTPVFMVFLIGLCMGALYLISRVTEVPLPHILIESTGGRSRTLAIILSGASGWLTFDQRLAERLAAARMDVMGIDSLRYFFQKKKTPALLAADLTQIIRDWIGEKPERKDVVLVGYAKGADVLPFAVNLLEPELREKIRLVTLLGIARLATFGLRFGDLMKGGRSGPFPMQVTPEIRKLETIPGLCVYGDKDRVSLCRNLKRVSSIEVREIKGGPVFHDADQIAELVLGKYFENGEPIEEPSSSIQVITNPESKPNEISGSV